MDYAKDLSERKKYAKGMLDSEAYKKISVWEKHAQDVDFTKVEKQNVDGKIEIVDISGSIDEPFLMSYKGNYRWFFEKLKNELKSEPTIFDYHCLYTKFLKELTGDFSESMFNIIENGNANMEEFLDVVYAHEKEELKLELVFIEYAEKLKISESNVINDTVFNEIKKKRNMTKL